MTSSLQTLITTDTRIRVSSTLDKSVGKKHLIDNNPETCWTSQQGLPQFIQLDFPSPVIPKRLTLTFQGGFAGTRCSIEVPSTLTDSENAKTEWCTLTQVYPEDVNRRQYFDLDVAEQGVVEKSVKSLKLVFEESSDFFGRITMYDLLVEGTTVEIVP